MLYAIVTFHILVRTSDTGQGTFHWAMASSEGFQALLRRDINTLSHCSHLGSLQSEALGASTLVPIQYMYIVIAGSEEISSTYFMNIFTKCQQSKWCNQGCGFRDRSNYGDVRCTRMHILRPCVFCTIYKDAFPVSWLTLASTCVILHLKIFKIVKQL